MRYPLFVVRLSLIVVRLRFVLTFNGLRLSINSYYQLAFVTPGIFPAKAISLNIIRFTPK